MNVDPRRSPRSASARLLAGALALTLLRLVLASALAHDALSRWPWIALLTAAGVLWWTLRRRTSAVAERWANELDERELADRNRTAWWGFVASTAVGTGTALFLVVAANIDSWDSREGLARTGTTLVALMLAAAALPTMVLAADLPAQTLDQTLDDDPDD